MTMANSFDSPESAVMLALVMMLAAGSGLALLCIFFPDSFLGDVSHRCARNHGRFLSVRHLSDRFSIGEVLIQKQ
jgi:hypothetical protein